MEQLIAELISLLEAAGLPVIAAQPSDSAPRLTQPACAVSLEQAQLEDAGMNRYLGTQEDDSHNTRELYGARLDAVLCVQVYSPMKSGAAACSAAAGRVADAVLGAGGVLTPRRLEILPCSYDPRYDHFTVQVKLHVSAWAYRSADEDAPCFIDFNLRGEMT